MLLANFYTSGSADTTDGVNWTISVRLNAGHAIYQGHFPEQPVVPGVCILQIIKECTEQISQHPLQYAQITSCKFLSAIDPNETPDLLFNLTVKETEEGKFTLLSEGKASENCFVKLKASLVTLKS